MKERFKFGIVSLLFLVGNIYGGFAQSLVKKSPIMTWPPSTQLLEKINICLWKGGAQTGVSLSFDDNCYTHKKISLMLDEYGFKGSFFVNTSSMLLDNLKDILARGHEIGNHTYSHLDLTQLDSLTIDYEVSKGKEDIENILGIKCLSFASPFHHDTPLIIAIGFAHHPFIRNLSEYSEVKRTRGYLIGSVSTLNYIDPIVHASIQAGNMLLLTGHGIDGDGYDPMVGDSLRQLLDSLKDYSNKGLVWVSTVKQITQYENLVHEIQLGTAVDGDTLIVTLSGYLDEKYKDLDESPLSLEFVKSEGDSLQYLGVNLILDKRGHSDIITIDLKKTNIIKALIVDPFSTKQSTVRNNFWSVFPKPASDYINIHSTLPIHQTEVYDLTGKLMIVKSGPLQKLNTSSLKPGVYMIKVSTKENSYTEKISVYEGY